MPMPTAMAISPPKAMANGDRLAARREDMACDDIGGELIALPRAIKRLLVIKAISITADRWLCDHLARGRSGVASGYNCGTDRGGIGPAPGGCIRLRSRGASPAARTGDVRGGTGNPRRPWHRLCGAGDSGRRRPDRR